MVQSNADSESNQNTSSGTLSQETDAELSTIIRALLERFLFQPSDLARIKDATAKLVKGEMTPREFKELLLDSRLGIINELVKVILLYIQDLTKNEKTTSSSHIKGMEEENERLRAELREYEELINDIIPRIQGLEQQFSIPAIVAPNPSQPQETVTVHSLLEKSLEGINIKLWLLAFRYDEHQTITRDDCQFFQNLFAVIQNIYKSENNILESDKVPIAKAVQALNIPKGIKAKLKQLHAIRTDLSHRCYNLTTDDVELVYTTYFQIIFFLLSQALSLEVKEQYQQEILKYCLAFINRVCGNIPYIASIGENVVNQFF